MLPKIETDNDLLMVLMDEELRSRFFGNAEALRKLPIMNWHDVTRFCLINLNWSKEELESAIVPEARPLLKDHLLNNEIHNDPEKAWSVLSRPEAWKPDHPTLYDREVLLWRASETMAKANPERFLKDLPSLPEESRKGCLLEAVPGLMSALEPAEAVAAVRAQLDAFPAEDHREVFNKVFDTALLHPSGEESVREMLETLPEGPERESLKKEFEEKRLAATRDDPLQ